MDMSCLINKKWEESFMDNQKKRTSAGDIRLELNEICRMQKADAKDSMEMARFTKTTGGSFTIICC